MDIAKIMETVDAEILFGAENFNELDITKAVAADLMSEVMLDTEEGSLIITGLINPQVIRSAEMLDVYAVLFVRDKSIPANILELAADRGVTVLRTPLTMFEACGQLDVAGVSAGQLR